MPQLKTSLPQEEMDEEDMRVTKEIQKMIKDEAFNGASNDPGLPAVKLALCLQNDSKAEPNNHATLNAVVEDDKNVLTASDCQHAQSEDQRSPASDSRTKQQFKISAGENNTIEDKQLAEDIEYILNDDISIDESSKQMSSGATSPTEKVQSPKKCPTSKIENMEGDNLEKDTGSTSKHEDNKGKASGKIVLAKFHPSERFLFSFQLKKMTIYRRMVKMFLQINKLFWVLYHLRKRTVPREKTRGTTINWRRISLTF